MAVDNARSLALLRKLDRLLARTKTHARPASPRRGAAGTSLQPESVHLIRTTARRLEALLDTLEDGPGRKQRKLRKRIRRLRRGAGGVRDIDVQIVALRKLKIGREQQRKAHLMQVLSEKRVQRERQLAKALDRRGVQKIRKGLRRWSAQLSAKRRPAATAPGREFDGVTTSLRMFSTLSRQVGALTPDNLHPYRTRCKRIRYVAEMAGNGPAARRVVEQLKRIQDAIGDWHDWQTLTQTAEALFARSLDSALLAALHNVTNAKFVEARAVCQESRRVLLAQYRAMLAEKRAQRAPAPKPARARKRRKRVAQPSPPPEAAPEPAQEAAPENPNKAPASVGMATSSVA